MDFQFDSATNYKHKRMGIRMCIHIYIYILCACANMCPWCSQAAALLYPVVPSHAHVAGVAVNPVASHCAYGNSFHVGVQAVALMAALLCCSAAVVETVPVPIEPIPKKVTDRLFVVGRPHPPETVLKYIYSALYI